MIKQSGTEGKLGRRVGMGCAVVLGGFLAVVVAGFAFARANGREVKAFCDGVRDGEPVDEVARRATSSGLRVGPRSKAAGLLIIINSSFTRCEVDHDGQRVASHRASAL